MLRRWTFRVVIAVCLGLMMQPAAEAQIRFTSTGGLFGGPTFANYPGGAWGGGWGSPYAGMWGGGYPGWGGWNPYYGSYSGWMIYPGIAAVSTNPAPRARATLEPAVAVDPDILFPYTSNVRQANYTPDGGGQQAAINVVVPIASAEVMFDGVRAPQAGTDREYLTPPLENGKYTYDVRVRWTDAGGKQQTYARTITFRPGDRIRIVATEPGEQLPAPKKK